MNTAALKNNISKIMTSEFKDSEKKQGIKLLIDEYSKSSGMQLSLARDYIESLVKKQEQSSGTEKSDWGV